MVGGYVGQISSLGIDAKVAIISYILMTIYEYANALNH